MVPIDEDRVYAGGRREATLLVATEGGLVRASVTGDRVGRFGIVWQGDVYDVAADDDRIVIATAEGVLTGAEPSDLASTSIDSATAVGVSEDGWVVGDSDGRIFTVEGGQTRSIGQVAHINAIDPPLIGTTDGLYRLPDLVDSGLSVVGDVSAQPIPLAATSAALYKLGNGWISAMDGDATLVTGEPSGMAAAVVDGTLYRLRDGDWHTAALPTDSSIADIGVGPALYVVTVDGVVFVDAGDGWRHRTLGISPVRQLSVRREST